MRAERDQARAWVEVMEAEVSKAADRVREVQALASDVQGKLARVEAKRKRMRKRTPSSASARPTN